MKIKDIMKKYINIVGKKKLQWGNKKYKGKRTYLEKPITLLKPKLSKKNGGDDIILDTKLTFIVVRHSKFTGCTDKWSTPKGITLNKCLEHCAEQLKYILVNAVLWDEIDEDEKVEDHLKNAVIKSYQIYRNYFIISI
jgi:hypothetical protein